MRISISILALGAAFAATPALAQLGVGLGGQAGAGLGVGAGASPGGLVGGVTGTLDRTVGGVDRTLNGALDSNLRLATGADLRAGATVSDNRGRRLGVVKSLHGDMAVVARGNRELHIPLAALYRGSAGLVTRLSRSQLEATASARASGNADIRN